MRHVSPANATFALLALSSLAACKVKDPLYCDPSTPCTDSDRPFCDDEGAYAASEGIKHTCIPYPWDAGPDTDAGSSCTPGEWTLDTIVAEGNIGSTSAIVVDSHGVVHVTYTDDAAREVRYAHGGAGNWTIEETTEAGGYYLQMAIDASDRLHVAYPGLPSGVRYLTRLVGAAEFDGELAAGEEANDVGMALDLEGHPTICYSGMTGAAECTAWSPEDWTSLPLPPVESGAGDAVAIDSDGVLHLIVDGIEYTKWTGSEWTSAEAVAGDADFYGAIAVDEVGVPHVAYRELSTGAIRHAYRVGPSDWMREDIDSSVDTLPVAGFVLRPDAMYAVYAEQSTTNLKYAIKRNGVWMPETVDSTATIPRRPSLFVDAKGGVHVSYFDQSDRDLRYAYLCP
jgi:predicted small lipoprotein YifL